MASDSEVVTTEGNGKRKRQEKCIRTYLNEAGEDIGTRAKNEARAVRLQVPEAGYDETLRYEDMPEPVRAAAALYGAVNSITNTIGKAGISAQEIVDNLESRIEAIFTNGVWAEGAQTGPRTTDVLDAMCRLFTDRGGDVTEEWKAAKRQKLAEDKAYADAMRAQPEIAVLIETIRMERQADRLKKAKEALEGGKASTTELDDLLS
jgi:hypothetical protein